MRICLCHRLTLLNYTNLYPDYQITVVLLNSETKLIILRRYLPTQIWSIGCTKKPMGSSLIIFSPHGTHVDPT